MYEVKIQKLAKRFGSVEVLKGIDLEIKQGEMFFLLGPSGCGKTTLLRILAGFEQADAGAVRLNGNDAAGIAPQRRNISMVFQSYALWPHLTVAENVAFGLENRKIPRGQVREKVGHVLSMVRMDGYGSRLPNQLSGGQQQRIALARALVVGPDLVLLDEPLSNLDARLRAEMRIELLRLQKETGVTAVYVTHDQEEALSMADRIGFMDEGRLLQVGTPQELYKNPNHIKTGRFLGNANLIEGIVEFSEGGQIRVRTSLGILAGLGTASVKARVHCFFRPESADLACIQNRISGTLIAAMYAGGHQHLYLDAGNCQVQAYAPSSAGPFGKGQEFSFGVLPENVLVLESA